MSGIAATMRANRRGFFSSARLRHIVVLSVMCLALYCFLLVPDYSLDSSRSSGMTDTFPSGAKPQKTTNTAGGDGGAPRKPPPSSLLDNRSLTSAQCRAAFPGLTKEIDDAVSKGPFTLRRNRHGLGPTIARIRSGRLSVLSRARPVDLSRDMLQHRSATLHQIAAALLTAPPSDGSEAPLPDTVFAFNHEDDPVSPSWSYSRPADPLLDSTGKHIFAIPHFSFYAWALPTVGSFGRAASAIARVESSFSSWGGKDPRAVWRGTAHFNNPRAGRARQNLVAAARGRAWADVEALHGNGNGSNALRIEDFCRYRYVVHTEGITYSGRFQYHQLCASVVLTPPIAWMQHLTHLARPVFSYDLLGSPSSSSSSAVADEKKKTKNAVPYPASWVQTAWPTSHAASTANIVFVSPDWSDLGATIAWLEAHPSVAAGIAARQRQLYHDGGYFSPAAEMCYWRALIRGWASVVRIDEKAEGFDDLEEVPWEELSITEVHK
ncbi:hypothetical protein AAE478_006481 [Parahypoxylon ruwenzoriense]